MAKAKKEETNKELTKELNIDKKALVDEIKKEIKETLDSEIEKKIDYETRYKLDKMERRIYRQKRWALIRRDIIILLFLGLILYEGKILYDNGLLFDLNKKDEVIEKNTNPINKEENNEDETNTIEEENKKTKEWYIENYSHLLDNVKTNLTGDDKYYLYRINLKASDIKSSIKLNMAYQLFDKVSNDGIIRISEEDMQNKYMTIFGNLDAYEPINFTDNCINFVYNKDNKTYMAIDSECESSNRKIIRAINNIYEEEDNIVIEANVGILDKENNTISNINSKDSYEYNDKNIDKLKTYKFIFKDNYLLEIKSE